MIVIYASNGCSADSRVVRLIDELFDYPIELVTTADAAAIKASLMRFRWRKLSVRNVETDPGRITRNPFTTDAEKTSLAWDKTFSEMDALVDHETALLRSRGNVRLVISDMSWIAQVVAERIEVPSVCLANFDWKFMHGRLLEKRPELAAVMNKIADISSRFDHCLVPGPACDPLGIGKSQVAFEWMSRSPRMSRPDVREKLGLDLVMDSVLLALDAKTVMELPKKPWADFAEYGVHFFVLVPGSEMRVGPAENVHFLSNEAWCGMRVDIVNTVDVVMGPMDYGLAAEVATCRRKFLIVESEEFPEVAPLMKSLVRYVPFGKMTMEQLLQGDWYKLHEVKEMEIDDHIACQTDAGVEVGHWVRKLLGDKTRAYIDPMSLVKWAVLVMAIIIYFIRRFM